MACQPDQKENATDNSEVYRCNEDSLPATEDDDLGNVGPTEMPGSLNAHRENARMAL